MTALYERMLDWPRYYCPDCGQVLNIWPPHRRYPEHWRGLRADEIPLGWQKERGTRPCEKSNVRIMEPLESAA